MAELKKQERDEEEALVKELKAMKKQTQTADKRSLSVQQTIPFKDYKNGIFELEKPVRRSYFPSRKGKKKDSLRSFGKMYSVTFSFEDMNYDILDPQQAETKYNKWKDMLNTLSTDCEAFLTIVNQKKDLAALKETVHYGLKNDGYDHIRKEWNTMMDHKIEDGQSYIERNRYFTLRINEEDLERAARTLRKRETQLSSHFNKAGTSLRRLSTLERGRVLYDLLNGDKIGEFDPDKINYLEMKEAGIDLSDLIMPDAIDFKPDADRTGRTFVCGGRYGRVHYIARYPEMLTDQIFNVLADQQFDCILTLAITPEAQDEAIKLTSTKRLALNSMLLKKQRQASREGYDPDLVDHSLIEKRNSIDKLMDCIQSKNEKMFYFTFTIAHFADTFEELEEDSKTLRRIAASKLCDLRCAQLEQEAALKQTLPLGYNLLSFKRTGITNMVAAFMPFLSQEMFHAGGTYYGLNKISHKLIFIDRWALMNANGFVVGTSGAGKSFSAKEEIIGKLLGSNADVMVTDPDGEYSPFVALIGGQVIEVSDASENHINPMDMDADYGIEEDGKRVNPLIKKTDFIISLCEEAIKDDVVGISAVQRAFIGRCVGIVYEELIAHDYAPEYVPTLLDLQEVFDKEAELNEEVDVAVAFSLFSRGSLNAFSHRTNVKTDNRLTVFDISRLGNSLTSMGQLIMTDFIWNKTLENKRKGKMTALISDEFTVMLRKEKSKIFFLDVYKRIRKLGGSVTGITQNVTSILNDEKASEMLANAEFVKILNQASQDCDALQALYGLSDDQREFFQDVPVGHGLIKAGKYYIPFVDEFPQDTALYKAMTTNPKERAAIARGEL